MGQVVKAGAIPLLALLLLAAAGGVVQAMPLVDVQGLFAGRAVVLIDDERHVLAEGDAVAGVSLISASSDRAVFEYQGQRFELGLTSRVGGSYAEPSAATVRIRRDGSGMYRSHGRINGHSVEFLVDTGASAVAFNSGQATAMGVDYRRDGTPVPVTTASGEGMGFGVTLDTVSVGDIRLRRVRAVVLEGSHPRQPLLGMSFLNRVRMQNRDELMILERAR